MLSMGLYVVSCYIDLQGSKYFNTNVVLLSSLIQQEFFLKTISCVISNNKIEDRMPMIVDSTILLSWTL